VSVSRPELIDRVEKNYEALGSALMPLAHAREEAKAILEILASAEVRLATALANVEAEEDPRPRDRGSDSQRRRFFSMFSLVALCDHRSGKTGGS
jgi:hypothetical protein